jgi:histidyl-tRNA synthetase
MGDVVLGELLKTRNLFPAARARTDFWVAAGDDVVMTDVMRVASELRRNGRSVEYSLKPQQLSRQLKAADAAGAENAVVLKRDDLAQGRVTIRDLRNGGERALSLSDLINSMNQANG